MSWILANKDKILEYYQCAKYEKVTLADCVAVLTPFAAQAGVLEKMLAENALLDF